MEKFVTNIKKTFKKNKGNIWPPGCSDKPARLKLTVIKFERGASHLHVHKGTSDNTIKQSFLPLSYGNLFKDEPDGKKPVRRIIVEGDAGIGKTTFCVSVCQDWASGKLFQQFDLLLFIPLHYKKLSSAHSLSELLQLLHPKEKGKLCESIASYMKESKGKNVLIIADGWDKLSESEQKKESVLMSLLFGSRYSDLSVLLTVRSCSFFTIIPQCKYPAQLVKMQGFNKEDITKFILSQLADDSKGRYHFLKELESNPLVEIVCSIPLNCAIVCQLCFTLKEEFPSTMTELYTKMILHIVFKKKPACTFNSLPKELKPSWRLLCKFAFQTITKDHTTFSRDELNSQDISLSNKIFHFGLLLPSNQLSVDTDSFHFLHPTFQKYLAALHLVKQSKEMQLSVFQQFLGINHLNIMWRFFFGLYFTELEVYDELIITEAIQIMHRSNKDNLQICHCAFEARNMNVSSAVVKCIAASKVGTCSRINFGCVRTSYDCAAVIDIISSIHEHRNIEINFKNCSLREKQIHGLENALSDEENQLQVYELDFSCNEISDTAASKFFCKASAVFQSLEKLYLSRNSIGAECIKGIMAALAKSSSPTLTQLDLSFNPIPVQGLYELQDAVLSGTLAKLEILLLQQCLTNDADTNINFMSTFVRALSSKCQSLRRLDLYANDLGDSGTPVINEIISCLTSMRKGFDLRLNREYMSEVEAGFVAVMNESIREKGTIDYTAVHGVIVGPGRSGKNSLMRRLMGEGPLDSKMVSPSTGVLERVVKIEVKKLCTVAAAVNTINWRKLDYDEEALELMMSTAKCYSTVHDGTVTVFDDFQEEPAPDVMEYVYCNQLAREESIGKRHTDTEPRHLVPSDMPMVHVPDMDMKMEDYERPLDIFKRAVKLQHMDALREQLESSWSLYLTNTGGQMEFQELLPILVCGPSVFFVTFPLNQSLTEYYTVRYQCPDGSEKTYQSPCTLIEEILQTLATIAALDYDGPQHKIKVRPKVFFIGTYKDKLPQSKAERIIDEIDQQLIKAIEHTSLYQQNSIEFARILSPKRLIFTVNNFAEVDNDFQTIRSALQQCVERTDEFTIKCPSTWLVFSLILRAQHKSRQVLSYNDCFTIAQSCGMSDRTELNNALLFIHTRLGLVRYFTVKELNTLVVIDPQVLFDVISKFITETFISDHAQVTEIDEFQEMGIFSMNVLERISVRDHSNSVIPFQWIIKLLIYLRIAAFFINHKGEKKCFFPSILSRANETNSIPTSIYCSFNPPSLLIAFQNGFCPRGIPGALIVYLISNEMQSEISWSLHTKRIYKNQVSLDIGTGDITLRILSTHLEICFDRESGITNLSEVKKTCCEAFKQIQHAMKNVTARYSKSGCSYYFTFYCTRVECTNSPHPAEVDWHTKKLKCKRTNRRSDFPELHAVWTSNPDSILEEEMADQVIDFSNGGVSKHLGQIADSIAEWEGSLAEQLGLTPADIANIKKRHPTELNLQVRAALEKWK